MHDVFSLLSKCSQQFQLPITRFKQRQSAPFCVLGFKFSHQFQLQEHRFKQRQNAPYIVFDFKMLSAVSTSEKIVSYSVRMHHLLSLLSTFSQHFQLPKTSFKMRNNAPFSVLSFKTLSARPTLVYRSVLQVMNIHIDICEHSQFYIIVISIYSRSY